MSTTVKKKLCWNCEGNVSRQADNCPYCGVYLHREQDEDFDYEEDEGDEPMSPYQPPVEPQEENHVPPPLYTAQEETLSPEPHIQKTAGPSSTLSEGWRMMVFPLVFLLIGSAFLLFGLILALFSQDGYLTLRWNGNYWFVYSLLSLPMLYLGWKALQNISEET